ncbi:MAG TPA: hypothetical protein VF787_15390 [Thermoanaerobaculia bacterium]
MTTVNFHPAADAELLEATEWYLSRSLAAATALLRELVAVAHHARRPAYWRSR